MEIASTVPTTTAPTNVVTTAAAAAAAAVTTAAVPPPPAPATTTRDHTDRGIESVLSVLAARACGTATNDDVEAAIEAVLKQNQPPTQTRSTPSTSTTTTPSSSAAAAAAAASVKNKSPQLQKAISTKTTTTANTGRKGIFDVDLTNYDSDQDESQVKQTHLPLSPAAAAAATTTTTAASASMNPPPPVLPPPVQKRGRGRPRKIITTTLSSSSPSSSSPADPTTTTTTTTTNPTEQQVYYDYDTIPLGKPAMKMLRAFGDGPQPHPDVLMRVLDATRTGMQATLYDARAVRRKQQALFRNSNSTTRSYSRSAAASNLRVHASAPSSSSSSSSSSSVHYQFRALLQNQRGGRRLDELARAPPKCGFGMDELTLLFPEEMQAYRKWEYMHNSSSHSTTTTSNQEEENHNNEEEPEPEQGVESKSEEDFIHRTNVNEDDEGIITGGHLQDRMEQFDVRTDRMDPDNYLQFSTVRTQGSFIHSQQRLKPQQGGSSSSPVVAVVPKKNNNNHKNEGTADATAEEDKNDKNNTTAIVNSMDDAQVDSPLRGRPADGSTKGMSMAMIRFLHWLGFEITGTITEAMDAEEEEESSSTSSSRKKNSGAFFLPNNKKLTAPNIETTHALAYLAHDMLGRIVEKAIFWKNVQASDSKDESHVLLELLPGEQLQLCDIERALQDPEIRLQPLYYHHHHHDEEDNDPNSKRKAKKSKTSFLGQCQPQLYFGPGFEDRLEMELEEWIEPLTEEEIQARKEDEKYFAQFSKTPTTTTTTTTTTTPSNTHTMVTNANEETLSTATAVTTTAKTTTNISTTTTTAGSIGSVDQASAMPKERPKKRAAAKKSILSNNPHGKAKSNRLR